MPDSLVSIGKGAFAECNRLRSIEIPSNVSRIEEGAFMDVNSSCVVSLDTENPYYRMEGGILYSADYYTALYCSPNITNVSFNSIKEVSGPLTADPWTISAWRRTQQIIYCFHNGLCLPRRRPDYWTPTGHSFYPARCFMTAETPPIWFGCARRGGSSSIHQLHPPAPPRFLPA